MRSCARYSQAADDKTIHGHTSESNHTFKKIYQRTSINCQKIWQAIILLRIGIEIIHTVNVKVTQSCPTFCHPMDYTVCGILQAGILEWVAFPFSRDLSNTGIKPMSPTLEVDSLPAEPQGKPLSPWSRFKPIPPALEGKLNHWSTSKAPGVQLIWFKEK